MNHSKIPQTLKIRIIRNLKSILPHNVDHENIPNIPNMENIIYFLHIYNIDQKQTSTKLTANDHGTLYHNEKLTIWSQNIEGKLKDKLEPDSPMMIDIKIKQPHIIAIQEHNLKRYSTKAFRRIMKIK